MTENKFLDETKEQYQEDTKKYFGNIEGAKNSGNESAVSARSISRHLPGKEQEYKMAERYGKGFGKASRSGAFSKASTGHAFFPSGLKFASDFIDEHTPGKYKPQAKPFEEPEKLPGRQFDGPKPACIIVELCMDCYEPIDYNATTCYIGGVERKGIDVIINAGCITETNQMKLHQMGLRYGDFFLSVFHASCMEKVKEFRKYTQPLVLGGGMLSDKDRNLLLKYKGELHLHDGREINLGQWMSIKRLEKTAYNTQRYIIEQRQKGNTTIFRDDRKEL